MAIPSVWKLRKVKSVLPSPNLTVLSMIVILHLIQLRHSAVLGKTADLLSELSAGEDYVEDEAYFTCDSEEKAREVAAEYGGELDSYLEGVAVIKFDKSLGEVLSDAAEMLRAVPSSILILFPILMK